MSGWGGLSSERLPPNAFSIDFVPHDWLFPQMAAIVHHGGSGTKMGGVVQTAYPRKNWSSVMLFNCDHPANRRLSLDDVNNRPGRDLHAFYWLHDSEIGELPPAWNWLVNVQPAPESVKIMHMTLGGPWMPNWEPAPHDEIWQRLRNG